MMAAKQMGYDTFCGYDLSISAWAMYMWDLAWCML